MKVNYCQNCVSQSRYALEGCVINKTTDLVGRKWMLAVMVELSSKQKKQRFNELQRALFPITPKILTKRLKELEAEGMVERTELRSENLPAVDYALTKKGKSLLCTLKELAKWGQQWYGKDNVTCSMLKRLC